MGVVKRKPFAHKRLHMISRARKGWAMAAPTQQSTTLTVKEVMADLRLSKNAVYEAIARKDIPSIRVGRRILIPRIPYQRMLTGEAA